MNAARANSELRYRQLPARPNGASTARFLEPIVTVLAIVLAPILGLRSNVAFFTLSDLLFCVSLLLLAVGSRFPLVPFGSATVFWLGGISLLSMGLVICSIGWGDSLRGFIVVGQYVFSYLILGFILLGRDLMTLKRFINTWIFSVVSITVLGVTAYTWSFDLADQFNSPWRIMSGMGRFQALGGPNETAYVIALTVPLVMYSCINGPRNWIVGFLLLSFIIPLLITGVLLTGSVSGLAATCLSFIMMVVLKFDRRILLASSIVVAAFLAWLGIWGIDSLPEVFQKRVLPAIESGDIDRAGTYTGRAELNREAFEHIERSPLIGIGADVFRKNTAVEQPAHNSYLLIWVEGGLIALLGWLLMLASPILAALYSFQTTRNWDTGSTLLTVGIVFAFEAIGNAHMYARFWAVPLLMAMALCMSGTTGYDGSVQRTRVNRNAGI